jgi:hypothetical protein
VDSRSYHIVRRTSPEHGNVARLGNFIYNFAFELIPYENRNKIIFSM